MGGFHLFKRSSKETTISSENDKSLYLLQEMSLHSCDGYKSFFVPNEAEIKDRGQSDWLAKSLVLFQTPRFVMQCIACAIELTHLEVVTLAYASVNFLIYIFWWNKLPSVYDMACLSA